MLGKFGRSVCAAVAIASATGTFLAIPPGIAQAQTQDVAQTVANIFAGDPAQMAESIRNLVKSNPAALPAIIDAAKKATLAQQKAAGQGLGEAAKDVVQTNQQLAADIQKAVVDAKLPEMLAAFTDSSGDTAIAAVANGQGGGVGGIGGPTNNGTPTGSNGSGNGNGTNSTGTNTQTLLLGGGGSSSNTTTTGSVSPR